MFETNYVTGVPADRAEIVDFANYVFSQAHRPHNFKTLLPKTYDDAVQGIEEWHFLAKQNGRIRALIADRPLDLHVLDRTLKVGCVGTVSVHPYSRGEGHMKRLMKMMIDDAVEKRYDLLMLGGQRQRYGYFGFDHAGLSLSYGISASSVRHGLKNVDASGVTFSELTEEKPEEVDFACALAATQTTHGERPRADFLRIMHSWQSTVRLIRIDGEMTGYIMGEGTELTLKKETDLPRVIKALFDNGLTGMTLNVAPHQTERMALLQDFAEGWTLNRSEMINVLNWKNVVETLLTLKASYVKLDDGCVSLSVDGQDFVISVENGVPSVKACDEGALKLEHLEAERLLFGMQQAVAPDPRFKNWTPLPFFVTGADSF